MKYVGLLCLPLFVVATSCTRSHQQEYPTTLKIDYNEEVFGTNVSDPYRWLEDMRSDDVEQWVSQQDDFMKRMLHSVPTRPLIEKRIAELRAYSTYTSPIRVGEDYYFTKTEANEARAVLYKQKGWTGEPISVLDPKKVFNDSLTQIHTVSGGNSLGYVPSPDGSRMLISISDGRSRWFTTHVYDIQTMEEIEEPIKGMHNLSSGAIWSPDSKGFYYIRFDVPAPDADLRKVPAENPAIFYHSVGTSQSNDIKVFDQTNVGHNWLYGLSITSNGKYLIIDSRDGTSSENTIYLKSIDGNGEPLSLPGMKGSFSFLGSEGDDLFFYTSQDAPRGKIVGINSSNKKMTDVVPQMEETISGGSIVGGNALGYFNGKFVITYIKDGVPFLRGFDRGGTMLYSKSLPIDGSIWGGFEGSKTSNEVFFNFLGFTSPSWIYKIDAANGELTLFKKSDILFNADNYETKQVFYNSKDGTRVPMFITHKKNLELTGHNPALMYAYGAGGWVSFLWYQEHLLAWLEMGGVYAQPSIRGGGEYGEEWYAAGVRHNRQNAVDDYHAAAEYLIANGYTSAHLLAANGGSMSSALAATAVMQRPELFGAMILDRPVLDMLRYTKFTNGSAWTNDLGDPDVKDDFLFLKTISPYHLVSSNVCYPPTLVMVGDKDQVTPPAHAYKFVAAMQNQMNCENPVILKMMWGAGHTFGTTPAETINSRTDEITFLVKVFDMEVKY